MNESDIALFLAINEPTFEFDEKQYSVCNPSNELFSTWDSDGNTFDFHGVTALLDNWIINGKPFREIVEKIM